MRFKMAWLVLATTTAGLLVSSVSPASAAGPAGSTPASWTPSLATSGADGTVEEVRQLVPCGNKMYAVGRFTKIKQLAATYNRNNAFSFNATTGVVSAWNPNLNGIVNSVALSADCKTAYLGGAFKTAGGTAVSNLVSVNTTTGAVNTGFRRSANGQVNALLVSGNHLLVGGYFTAINGSARKYMASLNPLTGVDDGYVNLNISGTYSYVDDGGLASAPNATRVYNYTLSPDKTRLLVMGVFTSVGGQARRQIFMLNLGATSATVAPWYSTEFNQNCAVMAPFWLQDASWAPDGSKIFIATTGLKPANGPGYEVLSPRAGLCDVAAAFPTTAGPVSHLWVNYTGCDTLFSTAADDTTVYVGGHQSWMSNPGCGAAGPGAVVAPGMAGLNMNTGAVIYNPTRGRGYGAKDMLVTPAGLWIGSDNFENTNSCAGVSGHAGICFLPNANGANNPYTKVPPAVGIGSSNVAGTGYVIAGSNGVVKAFGRRHLGDLAGERLNKPIVGIASTPSGNGYWMVGADGGVFPYGDAGGYGSLGGIALNKPVVGIAATPSGKGYWLVAADGGVFCFGDAGGYGSAANFALNKPIVGMAATSTGGGYWLVGADGGIFTFGDAPFYGSTGGVVLNKPVVGMRATSTGRGYWLVAADGGIFNYGDAGFFGSTGGTALNQPVVGMTSSPNGGYWLVAGDGGLFNFNAPFYGSAA